MHVLLRLITFANLLPPRRTLRELANYLNCLASPDCSGKPRSGAESLEWKAGDGFVGEGDVPAPNSFFIIYRI